MWKGHKEAVNLLLASGAGVNVHNENTHWRTFPLSAATHANQTAIALILIEYGAEVNAKDLNGKLPYITPPCTTQTPPQKRWSYMVALMSKVVKPKRLKPGETVAVLSPSWGGPAAYPAVFDLGLNNLTEHFGGLRSRSIQLLAQLRTSSIGTPKVMLRISMPH